MAVVCGSRGKLRPWQAAALSGVVSGVILPRICWAGGGYGRRRPRLDGNHGGRRPWRLEAKADDGYLWWAAAVSDDVRALGAIIMDRWPWRVKAVTGGGPGVTMSRSLVSW